MKSINIRVTPSSVLSTRKITNKVKSMKKLKNSMFLAFSNHLRDLTTINRKIMSLK